MSVAAIESVIEAETGATILDIPVAVDFTAALPKQLYPNTTVMPYIQFADRFVGDRSYLIRQFRFMGGPLVDTELSSLELPAPRSVAVYGGSISKAEILDRRMDHDPSEMTNNILSNSFSPLQYALYFAWLHNTLSDTPSGLEATFPTPRIEFFGRIHQPKYTNFLIPVYKAANDLSRTELIEQLGVQPELAVEQTAQLRDSTFNYLSALTVAQVAMLTLRSDMFITDPEQTPRAVHLMEQTLHAEIRSILSEHKSDEWQFARLRELYPAAVFLGAFIRNTTTNQNFWAPDYRNNLSTLVDNVLDLPQVQAFISTDPAMNSAELKGHRDRIPERTMEPRESATILEPDPIEPRLESLDKLRQHVEKIDEDWVVTPKAAKTYGQGYRSLLRAFVSGEQQPMYQFPGVTDSLARNIANALIILDMHTSGDGISVATMEATINELVTDYSASRTEYQRMVATLPVSVRRNVKLFPSSDFINGLNYILDRPNAINQALAFYDFEPKNPLLREMIQCLYAFETDNRQAIRAAAVAY